MFQGVAVMGDALKFFDLRLKTNLNPSRLGLVVSPDGATEYRQGQRPCDR